MLDRSLLTTSGLEFLAFKAPEPVAGILLVHRSPAGIPNLVSGRTVGRAVGEKAVQANEGEPTRARGQHSAPQTVR
jgi:hypothetical protein